MSPLIYRTPSRQYTKLIANNIALWHEEAIQAHRRNYLQREHQNVYKAVETGLQVKKTMSAATELLLELSPFVEKYGYWTAWIPLLERSLEAHTGTSKRWVLQTELAFFYQMSGDGKTAVSLLKETLANLNKQTDTAHWGRVHYHLGNSYFTLEQYEPAHDHTIEALTIFENYPDSARGGTAPAKNLLGLINLRTVNYVDAVTLFIEARQQWEQGGEHDYALNAMLNEALIYETMAQYDSAEHCYQQMIYLTETHGSLLDKARAYLNFGNFYANQGDIKKAESVYLRVNRDALYQHGHVDLYTRLITNLGYTAMEKGKLKTAAYYSQEAISLWQQLGNEIMQANALENLGDTHLYSNNIVAARRCYRDGLDLVDKYPNNLTAQQFQQALAKKIVSLPKSKRG